MVKQRVYLRYDITIHVILFNLVFVKKRVSKERYCLYLEITTTLRYPVILDSLLIQENNF